MKRTSLFLGLACTVCFYAADAGAQLLKNPGDQNPTYSNPSYKNPGYSNPSYKNPGYSNPSYKNPGYSNSNPYSRENRRKWEYTGDKKPEPDAVSPRGTKRDHWARDPYDRNSAGGSTDAEERRGVRRGRFFFREKLGR